MIPIAVTAEKTDAASNPATTLTLWTALLKEQSNEILDLWFFS
jgi:hypothetical protein